MSEVKKSGKYKTKSGREVEIYGFDDLEFKPETRRYLFWFARILGEKIGRNTYMWRGKMWIVGPNADPVTPPQEESVKK